MNTAVTTASTPASAGQLFEIGNTIGSHVGKLLSERGLTKEQGNDLIGDKSAMKSITEKIVEELLQLAPADHIARYKKDLEKFFLKVYDLTVDLSDMVFPRTEGFDHYMIKPAGLDADAIYAGFKKVGLPSWKYIDGSIVKMKKSEQDRPKAMYGFAHKGGAEPDQEHLGKSYDDFIAEGKAYLTIDEYMLIEQFMWWKFKIHLDVKGWTRSSTLDSSGDVMLGGWGSDECWIGDDDRDERYPDFGPRSAVLF